MLESNLSDLLKSSLSFQVLIQVIMWSSFPWESVSISINGIDNDG